MIETETIKLRFSGEYALAGSVRLATRAAFVSPMRADDTGNDQFLDLVFPVEGSWNTIGVSIQQIDEDIFAYIVANPANVPAIVIRDRLEHILALDVDGVGFRNLAKKDGVVAELCADRPGVRPVLFPSPYEAAARAIIGHRLAVNQAASVHARLAAENGIGVEVGGKTVYGFPAPDRLAKLSPVSGLAQKKVEQLRALGDAASEGWLDTERLQAMSYNAAMAHLQELGGIGPFSAELIMMRGVGDSDAFPLTEMRLHRAMAAAYGLGDNPDLTELQGIAENWRPYRSWVGLLFRNRPA
jgi:DNA-3-methyladenine glycosylase II